jgi:hypothetical protein
MCNEAFPTSFSHSKYNYNKNNEKDGFDENGNYKCFQTFRRESLKDERNFEGLEVYWR